jgi:hypothetical protein
MSANEEDMMSENTTYNESQERKSNVGLKWIKADDSDSTYLCPTDKLSGLRGTSDAELRSICVDESQNPQND